MAGLSGGPPGSRPPHHPHQQESETPLMFGLDTKSLIVGVIVGAVVVPVVRARISKSA